VTVFAFVSSSYWNPYSAVPEPERFLWRKKVHILRKPPSSTEHLAEGLPELVSKGGLIDWYLNVKKVPSPYPSLEPGYEHQSILLGTLHSQGGRDGIFPFFFI
jgi:hypothetical protein